MEALNLVQIGFDQYILELELKLFDLKLVDFLFYN
ncbi:hypothetical protein XFF6991_4942 [Xanthomonas phaseoli pv. phaseoli]|uniref:Uncharacterized protein n=1 Tax=Xanthomonas campestris pv. phaseoli TaxID=317013 RepID=A0A7Z7IVB2_XANCH|nr:hypothetical protein XFF6991_4942 [Xanthomonas phaseoli pv. phaseoli]